MGTTRCYGIIAALTSCLCSGLAVAQVKPEKPSEGPQIATQAARVYKRCVGDTDTGKTGTDYKGDLFKLRSNLAIFKLKDATFQAPATSTFIVTACRRIEDAAAKDSDALYEFDVQFKCLSGTRFVEWCPDENDAAAKLAANPPVRDNAVKKPEDASVGTANRQQIYTVEYREEPRSAEASTTLSQGNSVRQSWTHGLLVVPFKFRLSDHSATGDATIGYYIGRTVFLADRTLIPVFAAGLSQIAVPNPNDNTKTDNKQGLTLATGLLWKMKDNFQLGAILGYDFIGKTEGVPNWKYNSKPWISFSVNFDFSK